MEEVSCFASAALMLKHLDSVCARAMAAMTSTLPEKLEAEQAREVEQASDAESTDSWFSDLNCEEGR